MNPSIEPFNKNKYKVLMDGLDATEIMLSELKKDNLSFRIDSDFFGKQVLSSLKTVETHKCFYLNPKNIVNGPFGSTITSDAHAEKGYMPLVRSININSGFFISKKDLVYISKEDNEIIKHSQLVKDDIVLSRVGSIGFFARVDTDMKVCNISSNNIGIKLDDFPEAEKHYILTYLNTELAKQLTIRRVSGNVQQKLTVSEICHIPIPMFSIDFYKLISTFVLKSETTRKNSFAVFSSAESILLSALKIDDLATTKDTVAIKALSDSFSASGRLDAEYYQPKYDRLFASLRKHSTQLLGGKDGIATIKKSIEPGSDLYCDDGIPFIRVSDVTKYRISEPSIKLPRNIVAKPNKLYPKKNTILFSKDGSVGIAYKVDKDTEVITSGALLHLTVRNPLEVLPDYLTLILNSPIVQLQAERDSNGAIIQHWKPSEIENVIIPIFDIEIQKEIAAKVQESFALRRQSEQLLEYAKQAVELAIEEGEEKAIEWLKGKVK